MNQFRGTSKDFCSRWRWCVGGNSFYTLCLEEIALVLETRRLEELLPYENNPRHNEFAVDAVAESVRQCGYVAPIVIDEDNVILAGHTRLAALEKLGYVEVDCIVIDGLTDEQKRKFRILDNKVGEEAEWDFEKLEELLADLELGDFKWFSDLSNPNVTEAAKDSAKAASSKEDDGVIRCPKCKTVVYDPNKDEES